MEETFRKKYKRQRPEQNDLCPPKKIIDDYDCDDSDVKIEHEDFLAYRSTYDRLFFTDYNIITYKSTAYEEFWKFLKKYMDFQKRLGVIKPVNLGLEARSPYCSSLSKIGIDISKTFDKCHLISFTVYKDVSSFISLLPPQDRSDKTRVGVKHVKLFRYVLLLFVDFLQKEKFKKLQKLRRFQADLPIAAHRNEVLQLLADNQIVILAGDTGCGKSTQIPQYLLQAGFQYIACTQPRRIACISLCKRVAHETLKEYQSEVGYQIRFEKRKSKHTRILFLTEGLLLRQVTEDPSLSTYKVIVLDEVHERHLHGDFLLGVVKCLVQKRKDVKIILMSATINIQLFQEYFRDQAPVVKVPGRLYPIDLKYFPVTLEEKRAKTEKLNPAPYVRILQLIDKEYPSAERGDLLVFLSGLNEINTVADACKEYAQSTQKWIILMLHSTLSITEQDKVFDYPPEGVRKCILSTNIAETSVTIDGVRFVVDSGKVKEMSYDATFRMQRLKEFWISRASAEQRKGRAGRTGPGVCYRLFSEKEYNEFSPYTTPEILRVPLDSVILQMISMGLPDARKFPFIESPPVDAIENALASLKEQEALDEDESLTPMGEMLSRLPVDVSIGKMLINGTIFHQIDIILILSAALSVQSPLTNRAYRDNECREARKDLESNQGDPLTLIKCFTEWLSLKSDPDFNSKKWCKRRGLEEQRFYEIIKLQYQFKNLLKSGDMLQTETEDLSSLSSAERSMRHGQVRHLHYLKREYHRSGVQKRAKLEMDYVNFGDEEEERESKTIDIGDVEFRLRHDSSQVQALLDRCSLSSFKDVAILKIILSTGLYPQVALADEHNQYKIGHDVFYHTRKKPFTVLHPMGVFANTPEILQLSDADVVMSGTSKSRHPVSNRHQLLIYLSLLETTKPYLMTTMRVPALQTLLLFSSSVDTNSDCSRLVFDEWIEVRMAEADWGMRYLARAVHLRTKWRSLLQLKLNEIKPTIQNAEKASIGQNKLEAELHKGLIQFYHQEEGFYSIKRLLAADLKIIYTLCPELNVKENPFKLDYETSPNEIKGGVQLAPYFTYNCLFDESALAQEPVTWHCLVCDGDITVTPLEKLAHMAFCGEPIAANEEVKEDNDPNKKSYYCPTCKMDLRLSLKDIIRHRKSHEEVTHRERTEVTHRENGSDTQKERKSQKEETADRENGSSRRKTADRENGSPRRKRQQTERTEVPEGRQTDRENGSPRRKTADRENASPRRKTADRENGSPRRKTERPRERKSQKEDRQIERTEIPEGRQTDRENGSPRRKRQMRASEVVLE